MMNEPITNKVAESGLVTLDLEQYYPRYPILVFDLEPFLFMGLVLKEKEFRTALQQTDWQVFQDKIVTVTCSADAIIPVWAYMLVASTLQPLASRVLMGSEDQARKAILLEQIEKIDPQAFADQRVVVKGCGDLDIGAAPYLAISLKLRATAKSILYGEPCSTVPVYKRK